MAREYDEQGPGSHLIWRVRLLAISDSEIVVERPATLGRTIDLETGLQLVAIIAVGQNRWMFNTCNLGQCSHRGRDSREIESVRLSMPVTVQRCQRRNYYRVETAGVSLPEAEVWPLLDPKSVVLAERCNEILFLDGDLQETDKDADVSFDEKEVMPEVGPCFTGTLMNLGGGGVGLRVGPDDSQALLRHKLFWLRIALPPELVAPVCATAKVVHTHMDSAHHTYAGLAFDFSFNPGHQRIVVDQICRYIAMQQRAQMQRRASEQVNGATRKSA